IANHAAFAAAIRNTHGGAFPRHPRSERLHFIKRDVWMITNAALRWSTRNVVLHAITFKHLHVAAVHLHRNRDDQLPLGIFQNVTHRGVEIEVVGCAIELLFSDVEWIEVFLKSRLRRHSMSSWPEWDLE